MDRGRRAEPYSNATIWTREIARNLAGHLSRVSKAHSCVDTKSPKSTRLPQFHQKRCPTSPLKTRQPFVGIPNLNPDQNAHFVGGNSGREESDASSSSQASEIEICSGQSALDTNNDNSHFRAGPNNEVNQDTSDKQGRIPTIKPSARQHVLKTISDTATYDSPPALLHQKHRQAHDYYKIQEQRKIWQENQALNKRLQTAKATLNFKEWEKDDKWSQEFLRHQEKRRYALQQELRRAQISPQAVLRSKPLKSLHRHARSAALETHVDENLALDRTKVDVGRVVSSRDLLRRVSKEHTVLGSRDTTIQRASAANHRRIVELRQKKPSSSSLVKSVAPSAAGLDPPVEQTAFIPDNEIVTVRFTFSRGRSRGTDNNTEQTDPSPLKLDGSDRDMMSLSGAFSPGVELESVLNDAAVEGTDHSQSPLLSGAEIRVDKSESYQSEPNSQDLTTRTGDSHDNQKIIQNMPEVAAESDIESAVKVDSEVTTIPTQSDDESYGDNFDNGALPSALAENQHDRLETSGYASEFEDGNTYDVTPNVNPIIGEDDSEDEEEYSHDDFE